MHLMTWRPIRNPEENGIYEVFMEFFTEESNPQSSDCTRDSLTIELHTWHTLDGRTIFV